MAFKKGVNPKTGEPVEKVELVKEEPRNMQVLIRGSKNDIRVIKKSEYDSLIHICL